MTNLEFSIISFLNARFDRSDKGEVASSTCSSAAWRPSPSSPAVFTTSVGVWFAALATEIGDALPG